MVAPSVFAARWQHSTKAPPASLAEPFAGNLSRERGGALDGGYIALVDRRTRKFRRGLFLLARK